MLIHLDPVNRAINGLGIDYGALVNAGTSAGQSAVDAYAKVQAARAQLAASKNPAQTFINQVQPPRQSAGMPAWVKLLALGAAGAAVVWGGRALIKRRRR